VSGKIVFNGKEYDGVEAMPAAVRREYEQALEANPGLRDTATSIPTQQRSTGPAPGPPATGGADARRSALVRIGVWVVIGLVVLIWLLVR